MNLKLKQLTKNRLLLAATALALSGGIAFGIAPIYQKNAMETIQVVCVDTDVGKGEQLLPEVLKIQEIPREFLPEGVVQDTTQTIGRYAAVDLQAGDWLTQGKLSDTTDLQAWYPKLNANQVAVSVSIKTLAAGVSAQLQASDIVSFVSANSDADTVLMPQLQYMEVLAVSTPSAAEYQKNSTEEQAELPATVTVLATPEQARLLADQDLNSNLHAVLVSRGNAEQAAALLAKQQEILSVQTEEVPTEQNEEETNG